MGGCPKHNPDPQRHTNGLSDPCRTQLQELEEWDIILHFFGAVHCIRKCTMVHSLTVRYADLNHPCS